MRARQPARAAALFVPARALEMSPRRTEGRSAVPEDRPAVTLQSHSAARSLSSLLVQCQLLAARSRILLVSAHALPHRHQLDPPFTHGDARIFRSQNIAIFPPKACTPSILAPFPRSGLARTSYLIKA